MSQPNAYPLTWPAGKPRTEAHLRQRATFSTLGGTRNSWQRRLLTISEATGRLFQEIGAFSRVGHVYRIYPGHVVVSTNQVLNRDGSIRSGMRDPEDPGVAVYFKLDEKPYCLPCDKWDRVADNLAAIAAHLGAMRGMERWGVGSVEQAFTGYLTLNEKTESTCWEILGIDKAHLDSLLTQSGKELLISDAFKALVKVLHPDNPESGDTLAFHRLIEARRVAFASIK